MQVFVDANICWDPCKRDLEWAFLFYRKNEHPEKKLMSCYIPDLPLYHFCCLFLCHGDHCGETNLLISARPQRQTNVRRCRIFGDLDQLKSKDTIQKNGRLIPTAKRGKEIKQQWREIKTSTIYLPDISVLKYKPSMVFLFCFFCIHFLLAPVEGLFFKPKYRANILYLF